MKLNSSKVIRYIYHISDIHIRRSNERDEEYRQVFKKLNERLADMSEDSLIVCTGDIFHDGLSSTSIMLAKELFIKLSERSDIILFRGNHDQTSKSNTEAVDNLYSVLCELRTDHKLYILTKTGEYEYGNIIFGYTDIYDTKVYQVGETDKIKIGLWHGTIGGSKNDSGKDLTEQSKFTKEEFACYDYVMLGDIHKAQYINKDKTIAYSGSLIQQNHGESLLNHGYIRWDLEAKTSEYVQIENEYGYVTVEITDTTYDIPKLPRYTRLRIIGDGCTQETIGGIYGEITKLTQIISYEERKEQKEFTYGDETERDNTVIEINTDERTIERLMTYIDENDQKISQTDKATMRRVLTRIVKGLQYDYEVDKKNIKLKSLIFNNFNIYGSGNCIDYESMEGIVNVCGKNGIGKSTAAVEVLLYAIYGLSDEKDSRYDYVNNHKRSMMTSITLDVNGEEYRILREGRFAGRKQTRSNFSYTIKLYKDGIDISGANKDAIETEIIKQIGKRDKLIKQCIMEQKKDISFLNMDEKKRRKMICKILKLNIYDDIQVVLEQESRALGTNILNREQIIYEDPKKRITERATIIQEELDRQEKEIIDTQETEKRLMIEYKTANKEKIEREMKLAEIQEINDENKTVKSEAETINVLQDCKDRKAELKIAAEENNKSITSIEKMLSKYKNMEKKKIEFDTRKEEEVQQINDDIRELMKGQVTNKHQDINIKECLTQKKGIESEKERMIKEIDRLKRENEQLEESITEYNNDKKLEEKNTKYLELVKEEEKININKEKYVDKLEMIKLKINKNERHYQMIKKEIDKKVEHIKELEEEITTYGDIERKKEEYETDRQKQQKALMKEIQESMKKYESYQEKEIDEKGLKQEKEEIIADLKVNKRMTKELRDSIIDVDEEDLEEHYAEYVEVETEYERRQIELSTLNKRQEEYKRHAEMLKNHKFNKKCKVCMSNDLTKEKLNTDKNIELIRKEIEAYEGATEVIKARYEELRKYGELKEVQESNNKKIQEIKENIKQNKMHEQRLELIEADERMYKEMQEKMDKNKQIDERVTEINAEIRKLQKERFEEYDEYKRLKKEIETENNEKVTLEMSVKEHKELLQNEEDLKKEIQQCDAEIETIRLRYGRYAKYNKIYEENVKKADTLNKNRQEIERMKEVISKLELKLDNVIEKVIEYENQIIIKTQNGRINKMIRAKEILLDAKKSEKFTEYEKYERLSKEYDNLKKEQKDIQLQIKEIELREITTQKEYEANKDIMLKKELYKRLKSELNDVEERYKTCQNALDAIKVKEIRTSNEINARRIEMKAINKAKEELKDMEAERNIYTQLIDIIKNGLVDNLLTKRIIPKLCDNVNEILSSFVNYKIHMEYDNKKLKVYKKDNDNLLSDAKRLSGYETLMANIAFRLTINNIDKLYKTNFFIIDEGFAYCDEQAVTKITNLFEYMRRIYKFVIVVSHNEQIKSYTNMDVPIQTKGGYSYINMITEKNKKKFIQYNTLLTTENDDAIVE